MKPHKKEYIGDGVYATYDGFGIRLTTEDGYGITNQIYFEPSVWRSLVKFVAREEEDDYETN